MTGSIYIILYCRITVSVADILTPLSSTCARRQIWLVQPLNKLLERRSRPILPYSHTRIYNPSNSPSSSPPPPLHPLQHPQLSLPLQSQILQLPPHPLILPDSLLPPLHATPHLIQPGLDLELDRALQRAHITRRNIPIAHEALRKLAHDVCTRPNTTRVVAVGVREEYARDGRGVGAQVRGEGDGQVGGADHGRRFCFAARRCGWWAVEDGVHDVVFKLLVVGDCVGGVVDDGRGGRRGEPGRREAGRRVGHVCVVGVIVYSTVYSIVVWWSV